MKSVIWSCGTLFLKIHYTHMHHIAAASRTVYKMPYASLFVFTEPEFFATLRIQLIQEEPTASPVAMTA